MEFLTNSYVTLTTKSVSTNETVSGTFLSGTEYLLVEVDYASFLNAYGTQITTNDGVLLELETYTKAVYTNYDVYDFDTNTKIGTYRFTQAGTIIFYIDSIYNYFGKVKLKLVNPTLVGQITVVPLINEASIYVHDKTEYVKPAAVLNCSVTKYEYLEGESYNYAGISMSAIYFDNSTNSNVTNYICDINRPLELTDEYIEITHAGASVKRYFTVLPVEKVNNGLKSYTKQFTDNIGNISFSANLYELHGNMHIILPIFNTVGYSPIDISLVFNHQDKSVLSEFGNGFKLNYYKKLEYVDSTTINVYNNDGSMNIYSFNTDRFENVALGNYIIRTYDSDNEMYRYKLYNKNGDYLDYLESNMKYPQSINLVSGEKLTFTFDSNNDILKISNLNNDVVSFVKNENSFIKNIIWKHNDITLKSTLINYTNSIISSVLVQNNKSKVVAGYAVNIGDEISIKDALTGDLAKIKFISNRLTEYTKGLNTTTREALKTTISYSSYKTTVSDVLGNSNTYVFDSDGILRYEIDSKNNYISYEFDKEYMRYTEVMPHHISNLHSNDNLLKDKEFINFEDSGVSVTRSYDDIYSFYSIISSNFYNVRGTGTTTYSFTNTFNPMDVYTLVIWIKQNNTEIDISNCELSLTLGEQVVSKKASTAMGTGEYYPIVLGAVCDSYGDNITLKLELTNNANIVVSDISLIKKNYGAFYQYDENGNVISKKIGKKESNFTYNENNKLEESLSSSSKRSNYKYDSKNNVTRVLGAYQVKTNNIYDSKNRLVKSVTQNYDADKVFDTANVYTTDYDVINYDELNNQTRVSIDNYGNLLSVTNALGEILSFEYDDENKVIKTLLTKAESSKNITYTYDVNHHNMILTATISNGCCYTFGYDTYDRLTTISNDEETIVTYVYDEYDRVISLCYNVDSDYVNFVYNNDNSIYSVTIGDTVYRYEYNSLGQLTYIRINNYEYKYYQYDIDNKLVKVRFNGDNTEYINYEYDNLDNVISTEASIDDNKVITAHSHLYRSNGCNPESLNNAFDSIFMNCMFIDNNLKMTGPEGEIAPVVTGTQSTTRNGIIPCYDLTGTNRLEYSLSSVNLDRGTYGMWIKLHYPQPSINLLSIESDTGEYVKVSTDSSYRVIVRMKNSSGETATVLTTQIQLDTIFNFIGLNWVSSNGATAVTLIINGICYSAQVSFSMSLGSNQVFIPGEGIRGLISSIMCGNTQLLSTENIIAYYRTTNDYIFSKNNSTYGLDFSNTTVYNTLDDVEVFPLQNNLKSFNGIEPVKFEQRRVSVYDRDRTFNFNTKSNRYAYVADGGLLEYNLDTLDTYTIGMNIYVESVFTKQKIFEFQDPANQVLGLYIDSNKQLVIEKEGSDIETGLYISTKTWNFVGLSINKTSAIETNPDNYNVYSIRVFMDNQVFEKTNVQILFEILTANVMIGRGYQQILSEVVFDNHYTYFPLFGLVEMMFTKNSYLSLSEMNNIRASLSQITIATGYNEFGLESSKLLSNNNTNIMTKINSYKTRSDSKYQSPYINQENYTFNGSTLIRSYELDNIGNVVSISNSNSLFNNHTYTYDYRGYLESDNTESYTYDDNGNITSCGDVTYEYTSTNKDKLTKAAGETVFYLSNYTLNPSSWNGITYSWEGRRLVYYNDTCDVYYTYDDKGQRISKNVDGNITNYYYDGNKLISEINSTYRLDYLYDEYNLLFGFIYNNNRYYYVRDMLQNVIGIIDSNGNLIVQYNYNAYGNNMTITGNTTIGNINPFRYKGYYYDSESNMYYCNSRYYNPLWCRWLNADNVNYLNVTDINSTNLYMYCNNNPVMYVDPSGTWNWGVFRKIVNTCINVVVGAAIGAATGGVVGAVVGVVIGSTTAIATNNLMERHYSRLEKTYPFPEDIGDPNEYINENPNEYIYGISANCHQFTAQDGDNIKFVTKDGHYEAIYNSQGKLVTNPKDIGTYNYFPSNENPIMHGIVDVLPWILWGNSENDDTNIFQRIFGLF